MLKVIRLLVFVLVLNSYGLIGVGSVQAQSAGCEIKFSPDPPTTAMDKLEIQVKAVGAGSDNYTFDYKYAGRETILRDQKFQNDTLTATFTKPNTGWISGRLILRKAGAGLPDREQDALCIKDIIFDKIPDQPGCEIGFNNTEFKEGADVKLKLGGLKKSNENELLPGSGGYDVVVNAKPVGIYSTDGTGRCTGGQCNIGQFKSGTYLVEVNNRCGIFGSNCTNGLATMACPRVAFKITTSGTGGGPVNPKDVGAGLICRQDLKNCSFGAGESCAKGEGVVTVLGCIPTDIQQFVVIFYNWIIGVAGGIALLIMAISAIQMMVQGSDAKALQAAQQRFVAAALGLVFIIFSVFIFKVLGVDILQIPGFS